MLDSVSVSLGWRSSIGAGVKFELLGNSLGADASPLEGGRVSEHLSVHCFGVPKKIHSPSARKYESALFEAFYLTNSLKKILDI